MSDLYSHERFLTMCFITKAKIGIRIYQLVVAEINPYLVLKNLILIILVCLFFIVYLHKYIIIFMVATSLMLVYRWSFTE